MKKFMSLINREFWEQRGVFFTMPVVIAIFMLLSAFIALVFGFDWAVNGFLAYNTHTHKIASDTAVQFIMVTSAPFIVVMWLTVFYYYIGALYDDRKDGSILFWRSLPVSETQTVLSKLIAGNVLAPFCTWVCMMVVQLVMLALTSLFLMAHGHGDWYLLWLPMTLIVTWLHVFMLMLFQGVWLLPLFAWFMFCGSFAKKAPVIRAVVPVLLIMMLDMIFTQAHYFCQFIISRFAHAAMLFDSHLYHDHLIHSNLASFGLGLGVAMIVISAAIFVRKRPS